MTKTNKPIVSMSTWSTLKKIQYGSLLFIVVLAYMAPMNVLERYPQFVPFVDFMANWNLQIRRVGEFTGPASKVNMFVYSVAWCLIWAPMICEYLIIAQEEKKGTTLQWINR